MAANGMLAGAPPKTSGYLALWIVEGILPMFWVGVVLSIGVFAVQAIELLILWGLGILIMIIMLGLAGHKINERWAGALIDSRNKFSLSRLQITLWKILVLSAHLAVAMLRVLAMIGEKPVLNQAQALDIRFPEQLIFAMGIARHPLLAPI
jgi:predicted RND superfamily exporter protein